MLLISSPFTYVRQQVISALIPYIRYKGGFKRACVKGFYEWWDLLIDTNV